MGRPSVGDKKFEQVYVGVSKEEKKRLAELAAEESRPVSSFLRLVILDALKDRMDPFKKEEAGHGPAEE